MEILFITRNQEKIAIANNFLKQKNIQIKAMKIDCPEIQSDDNEEIAKTSAKYASDIIKGNVVKVDTGFYIEALNGFPGPYAEYVERKLDASDILKMMEKKANRKAYYKEVLSYCEYGKEPIIFTTYTYGTLSTELSGNEGYNFDRIFICDGDHKTMANFNQEERAKKYSSQNWNAFIIYLDKGVYKHE